MAFAVAAATPAFAADKKADAKAPAEAAKPWMNTALSADQRADLILKEM